MAQAAKSHRRWFQFSVRTMLIIVALLCVAIGYPLSLAKNEERASQQLINAGFHLSMDGHGPLVGEAEIHPRGPTWVRNLVGDYLLDHTRFVGLRTQRASASEQPGFDADNVLLPMRHLHHVEMVWLWGVPVTDSTLRPLAHLKRLRTLDLSTTGVTDEGLKHIANLSSLKNVNLRATNVTDAGLKHLRSLKNLRYLSLSETKVNGSGLEHLGDLHQLEHLDLDATGVHSADLHWLVGCTKLKALNFGRTKIDDSAGAFLRQMTSLEYLHMVWEDIGPECVDAMLELPNLKQMSVSPERLASGDLQSRLKKRFALRVESGMLIGEALRP